MPPIECTLTDMVDGAPLVILRAEKIGEKYWEVKEGVINKGYYSLSLEELKDMAKKKYYRSCSYKNGKLRVPESNSGICIENLCSMR